MTALSVDQHLSPDGRLMALALVTDPVTSEKLSPYECGFEAFEDSRMRFDVRYYLVAIIFIVFDLEIAFFFPWAVSLKITGAFGLIAMLIFALVLVVALAYDYKKGALEWD